MSSLMDLRWKGAVRWRCLSGLEGFLMDTSACLLRLAEKAGSSLGRFTDLVGLCSSIGRVRLERVSGGE